MEIVHRFGLKFSDEGERQTFLNLGVSLKSETKVPNGNTIAAFEFKESDPRWHEVEEMATKFQITRTVRTEFTSLELDSAEALNLFATSQRGYPQPSEKRGYLDATFDLSEYCTKCGVGLRQVRPFRLKSYYDLKRHVLQLNWIFDEFFVSREIWDSVFRPFAIDYWPVNSNGSGSEMESIVQLKIPTYVDLKIDSRRMSICGTCGRAKARMELRGPCPEPVAIPSPIFKSSQYFGPDGAAYRRVLVSSSLYRTIQKNLLRGVLFYPCGSEVGGWPRSRGL